MTEKKKKERADELLVSRGMADSRSRAKTLIMMGRVYRGETRVDKAGELLAPDAPLRIDEPLRYVSRGGLKVEAALDHFAIDVRDRTAVDIGASTGGFTDCLLQRGATRVYAVDVGHGILDAKLRQDPRVICIEKTNIRAMPAGDIPEKADLAVIDVSFISLTMVLPKAVELVKKGSPVIALVKPQFELSPKEVGRGGIVRDEQLRQKAVTKITDFITAAGLDLRGVIPSPIAGQKGNREFLVYAVAR